ncbi:carrier superfamily protein [Gracilaria domingensis]|nr:carrier superfamily protein [Gracilaria domingensis]
MEVAFRKSDQSNTGFISLDDMEELLHEYAEYDPVAQKMLTGENRMLSRTAVVPLELVKMQMQTGNRVQFSGGWIASMRHMIAEDSSIRRALFRQNGANISRKVPSTITQTALVTRLATSPEVASEISAPSSMYNENSSSGAMSRDNNCTLVALFAEGVSGMVSQTATYPFDFVRARLAMQRQGFEPYRGPFHGINEAMRMEGVRSIYAAYSQLCSEALPSRALRWLYMKHACYRFCQGAIATGQTRQLQAGWLWPEF